MTPRRARHALLLCLVALTALLLSGCAGHAGGSGAVASAHLANAPHPTTAPRTTVTHVFHAYAADGRATVTSTKKVSGYCWNSSLATTSPDAFRCFSGATILDPCFAPPGTSPATMTCVSDPWSSAITMTLTRPLPAPVAGGTTRPWAIELATGARCVASTGTVPAVQGVNLTYHCSDGTAAELVDPSAPLVTAAYARPSATALQHAAVTGVWRS